MQLLPSLSAGPKAVAREKPAGAHLPYAAHIDDRTIVTRDGLLIQCIQLRGLLFETADGNGSNSPIFFYCQPISLSFVALHNPDCLFI